LVAKAEIPNSKHQAPNKFQIPNSKHQAPNKFEIQNSKSKTVLNFEFIFLVFVWNLVLGISNMALGALK
jgi:hypothetical protein